MLIQFFAGNLGGPEPELQSLPSFQTTQTAGNGAVQREPFSFYAPPTTCVDSQAVKAKGNFELVMNFFAGLGVVGTVVSLAIFRINQVSRGVLNLPSDQAEEEQLRKEKEARMGSELGECDNVKLLSPNGRRPSYT